MEQEKFTIQEIQETKELLKNIPDFLTLNEEGYQAQFMSLLLMKKANFDKDYINNIFYDWNYLGNFSGDYIESTRNLIGDDIFNKFYSKETQDNLINIIHNQEKESVIKLPPREASSPATQEIEK